jgi:hypothetical protein
MTREICGMAAIAGLLATLYPIPVLAQTATPVNDQIKELQNEIRTIQKNYQTQIRNLQKQLDALKAEQAAPKPAPVSAPTPAPAPPPGLALPPPGGVLPPPVPGGPGAPPPPPTEAAAKRGGIFGTGINVSFGNTFIEAASIFRTRNETADISSNFNTGIPMPNNPNYFLSEFRESAHQSRLAMLAEGRVNEDTKLDGYFESDFQSAATTSNSVESNSYNPRLRLAYATLDKEDWGTYLLGGQAWSLLTMFKEDMTPRQEDIPLTIDGQYAVGFTWTRNPQFRVVQHFGDLYAAGLSLESPQAVVFSGPNAPGVPTTFSNPGGMLLNPLVNYSTDIGPDVVAKITADPGVGHFELYGVGRAFRSRANFSNHTILGGGGGAGAILPIIPKLLDAQADFLIGDGIARYGTVGLPDVAVKPDGVLAPIPEIQALVGLVGHPTDSIDLYAYGGVEQANSTSFTLNGVPFGYGNLLYNNSACLHEAASASAAATNCAANTKQVWQVTGGFWWDVYKGDFGRLRIGGQGSYTERRVFAGIGGGPNTNEGIFMASLRYYPFAP